MRDVFGFIRSRDLRYPRPAICDNPALHRVMLGSGMLRCYCCAAPPMGARACLLLTSLAYLTPLGMLLCARLGLYKARRNSCSGHQCVVIRIYSNIIVACRFSCRLAVSGLVDLDTRCVGIISLTASFTRTLLAQLLHFNIRSRISGSAHPDLGGLGGDHHLLLATSSGWLPLINRTAWDKPPQLWAYHNSKTF